MPAPQTRWIEFIKLSDEEHITLATQRFFGVANATPADFEHHFNVDLSKYPNFYLEVGGTDSLEGHLLPATVKPILVLQASHSGKSYKTLVMKYTGFVDMDKQHAWVDAVQWDKYVDDNLIQQMQEQAEIEEENQRRLQKQLEKKANGEEKQKQ